MAFQGKADIACRTTVPQVYNQSEIKPFVENEEHKIEKFGTAIYQELPYNRPIGAVVFIGNEIYHHDYRIPLSNHVFLEYNGSYSCNLQWSLE